MSKHPIIRRVLAGFMILLFAFCVTPKKLLHDLIADHRDTPFSLTNSSQQHIENSGFRCNCDNLVVESPFIPEMSPSVSLISFSFTNYSTPFYQQLQSAPIFEVELRGPPFSM